MTQHLPDAAREPGTAGRPVPQSPPEGAGQLPFALRIGVTGHRTLADPGALIPAIHDAIRELTEHLLGAGAEPALLVISALAEGADRVVAREVLASRGAELEAVLPLPSGEYLADFASDDSKTEFTRLLDRAAVVWQAPPGNSREEAYERAGRHIVDRCDVLIALWDGEPSRGRGGTATVLDYARQQGVPVAWVHTSGPDAPEYWYEPDRAERIREAAREFRRYNAAPIPDFPARAGAERDRLEPPAVNDDVTASFSQTCERLAEWMVPYFVRADVLAARLERAFRMTSWGVFLAAAAAVAVVAAQVTFVPRLLWITAAEVILLMLLVVVPLISRRRRVLERWISYRFLAERLRSAYFLALAGAGDPATRADRHERAAYLTDPTEVWLQRGLDEVMTRRPDIRIGADEVGPLRDYLGDRWIGAQIRYHDRTARRQGTWDIRLFRTTIVLFLITAVAAFLHLLGVGDHHGHESELGLVLVLLSICVPAIGAAVHGIRTQSEFRRHCERYERMAGLLQQLGSDMRRAQSLHLIHEIATDAERLMRAENSDWFGVMRFHDVELIT